MRASPQPSGASVLKFTALKVQPRTQHPAGRQPELVLKLSSHEKLQAIRRSERHNLSLSGQKISLKVQSVWFGFLIQRLRDEVSRYVMFRFAF